MNYSFLDSIDSEYISNYIPLACDFIYNIARESDLLAIVPTTSTYQKFKMKNDPVHRFTQLLNSGNSAILRIALKSALSITVLFSLMLSSIGTNENQHKILAGDPTTPTFYLNNETDLIMGREELIVKETFSEGGQFNVDTRLVIADKSATGYKTFVSNGSGYSFTGPSINELSSQGIVLHKGGTVDDLGVWIQGVYRKNNTVDNPYWLGWFHAEEQIEDGDVTCGTTKSNRKTISYMHSSNKGQSWTKAGIVLTAPKDYMNNCVTDDAGDATIITAGSYFYMFFLGNYQDGYGVHVARSLIQNDGKPGSWYKYYCNDQNQCGWTEKGIDGNATRIGPVGAPQTGVRYNKSVDKYIKVDATGKRGIFLTYTEGNSVLDWSNTNVINLYPAVSSYTDDSVDDWRGDKQGTDTGDTYTYKKSVYGYASLEPLDDEPINSALGQSFYLYYMKIYGNNKGIHQRNLFRRKITLKNSANINHNLTELSLYNRTLTNGTSYSRYSTEMADHELNYVYSSKVGYLATESADTPNTAGSFETTPPGMVSVYECLKESTNDNYKYYFLSTTVDSNWTYCNGNSDLKLIRRIGYLSTSQTSDASVPIYTCYYNGITQNSTDSTCADSDGYRPILGYAFNSQYAEQ